MKNWSTEIQELKNYYQSLSGKIPDLEKELERLIKVEDEIGVLVSSRRCLEVMVTDICDKETIKLGKTIPLKGIIDKLNKENIAPSHIITSMLNLNSISTYGAHPKEFDPRQVRTVLINLATIIEWYLNYRGIETSNIIDDTQSIVSEKKEISEPEIPKKKSIIVLPFANMSPDPDQEYFSDGLTEEIITDLSHIHDLMVISRTSAMTLKGTKSTIKEIAKKVNVHYVLEGSVRKAGNYLRITAQLIDALTDTHLWADKYNGTLDDVFDIQEKVSLSIVNALKIKLTPREEEQIAERPIDNVQAYELYLYARREMYRFTEDSIERAIRDLKNGLKIIGDNALLHAGVGFGYCNLYEFGINVTEETLRNAEEYAQRVSKSDPNSSHWHYLMGRIERFRGRGLKAFYNFKKALEIDPDDHEVLTWSALSYLQVGKPELSEPIVKRLFTIDPLNPMNYLFQGIMFWMQNKLDDALKSFGQLKKLEPETVLADFWSAYVLVWKGQYEKVFSLIENMENTETQDKMHRIFTGMLTVLKHTLKGEKREALDALTNEMKHYFWHDPDLPWIGACCYSLMNEKEEALNWLNHAINKGWINYPLLNEKDPFLENIRGEERFKKLMERVKYEWENFEV